MLGVSQSTVSRAFTPGASVAPAVRARVMQMAETVGYRPNVIARSLSTRRSNIVGVVMSNMTNPFYPEVLTRLSHALQQAGLQTLLFPVPPGQAVDSQLPLLLQYQVDAVVIASARLSSEMARCWTATGRPAVLFNRTVPGAPVASVSCDNVGGGRAVADFLIGAGRRRPAFVGGRTDTSTHRDRRRGFLGRLAELGVALHAEIAGREYSYEAGFAAARALAPLGADCVFFANDILALGGMDALRSELGFHVPDDIAVVGFDDIPLAAWPAYALTTLAQPLDEMIRATIAILTAAPTAALAQRLPGTLVRRRSALGGGAA